MSSLDGYELWRPKLPPYLRWLEQEFTDTVIKTVNALPEKQRFAFTMYDVDNNSNRDITYVKAYLGSPSYRKQGQDPSYVFQETDNVVVGFLKEHGYRFEKYKPAFTNAMYKYIGFGNNMVESSNVVERVPWYTYVVYDKSDRSVLAYTPVTFGIYSRVLSGSVYRWYNFFIPGRTLSRFMDNIPNSFINDNKIF